MERDFKRLPCPVTSAHVRLFAANLQQNRVIVVMVTRPAQIASTAPHERSSARRRRLSSRLLMKSDLPSVSPATARKYATRMWQLLDHHRNATIAYSAIVAVPISQFADGLTEIPASILPRRRDFGEGGRKQRNASLPLLQRPRSKSQKGP